MSHLFSLTPSVKVQRSGFDRSNTYKTTFNAGKLVPFYCDEVLPGDTVNLKASLFCRMATPIVPVMDNLYLETFFFFVPNRLVWNHWQNFMGEQVDPDDSIDYTIPYIAGPTTDQQYKPAVGSLLDYFGFPTGIAVYNSTAATSGFKASALPVRAYALIWNEFFRDQNLQDSVPIEKGDTNRAFTSDFPVNSFESIFNDGSCFPRNKRPH